MPRFELSPQIGASRSDQKYSLIMTTPFWPAIAVDDELLAHTEDPHPLPYPVPAVGFLENGEMSFPGPPPIPSGVEPPIDPVHTPAVAFAPDVKAAEIDDP